MTGRPRSFGALLGAATLLGAVLASGCSDAFEPFIESEQQFALFGFLDARQDTQFVRVQPIGERDTTRIVDARVTSTALVSGERVVWQDSLVRLDDGLIGTVFFAPFRAAPGERYRIEAEPPGGGATSTAEVSVPPTPTLTTDVPSVIGGAVSQVLTVESAIRPTEIRAIYTVRRPGGEPIAFGFDYSTRPVRASTGFEVIVSLGRNANEIRALLGLDPDGPERLALLDLRLEYDLIDTQSGTVSGGLGSFGAAARFASGWRLNTGFVTAIGFDDAQGEG